MKTSHLPSSWQVPLRYSFLTLLALAGLAAQANAQTIIYLENFTTPNNNANAFSEFGWGSIGSNGTANVTANGTAVVLTTSNAAGPQNTLAGVNNTGNFSSPTNGAAGNGFAYIPTISFDRVLAFTLSGTEYFGANRTISSSNLRSLSIQTGSSSSGNIRPAVLVGNTWYVLNSALTAGTAANAAAFTGNASQTQTWDSTVFASSNWSILDTSVAGFLINGTSSTLAAGNVNAMGFYYTTIINTGTQRFDNFTVTAVPEPATWVLLGLSAGCLLLLRRRSGQS